MAYSINPNLVKARKAALLSVMVERVPICIVSRHFGVHRTTAWRWLCKWRKLNQYVSQDCSNRPNRKTRFCAIYYRWLIETESSAPKSHPGRIAQWVIDRILAIRAATRRCAVIIHEQLLEEGIRVGVSTISRVVARYNLQKTKRRRIRRTLTRPDVNFPGDLAQIDTVHYVNKLTGERRYVFTVIDLYSRMAYAECFERLLPSRALKTVLEAERYFGFKIKVLQSDNGPEFSEWLEGRLRGRNIIHRHTRIHRPNDNAHIERFNRTLREECIGEHMSCHETRETINQKLSSYIDYYNNKRLHLSLQRRTPRAMLQR